MPRSLALRRPPAALSLAWLAAAALALIVAEFLTSSDHTLFHNHG